MHASTDIRTTSRPVRIETCDQGAIWRVWLATPKANILDMAMASALTDVFERASSDSDLKAICIEGEGPHFSFGASVQEHLPDRVAAMLAGFHRLFRTMLRTAVPTLAAVRGQCLGGGLELASFCQRLYAAPDAVLGQPEIKLGVFAPVASVFLPHRIGLAAADDLCLSGRSLSAAEAHTIGLVDCVTDDPSEAALAYARAHWLPRSTSSLRLAVRAVRSGLAQRFLDDLQRVERLYLSELSATHDAREGIEAFLEKRSPQWRNR